MRKPCLLFDVGRRAPIQVRDGQASSFTADARCVPSVPWTATCRYLNFVPDLDELLQAVDDVLGVRA